MAEQPYFGQPIRAINESVPVLDARLLPRVGFGQAEVTIRTGNNGLITNVVPRVFRLHPCKCCVRRHEELGPICVFCRMEKEQELERAAENGRLTQQELDAVSTPCKEHYRTCSYPLCKHVTACMRHSAIARIDGLAYCVEHFLIKEQEYEFGQLEERFGWLSARVIRGFRSLDFDLRRLK